MSQSVPLAKICSKAEEENKQKIPILHLTFTGMAQSRKVSEPCPRQRKNEEGKNDTPKRALALRCTRSSARYSVILLSKKRLLQFQFFVAF